MAEKELMDEIDSLTQKVKELEISYLKCQMLVVERERIINEILRTLDGYVESKTAIAFSSIWGIVKGITNMRTDISEGIQHSAISIDSMSRIMSTVEKRLLNIQE